MDSSNVSFGKGKATGAVFLAPKGTTVPTDATTALAGAYVNMGYISEDGYAYEMSTDTEEIKDWNGRTVLTEQSSYTETYTVNFLETKADTLKAIFGAANVTEAGGVITVKSTGAALEEHVLVIEVALTGGRVNRIVVPHAKIADRSGTITFSATEALKYPAIFSASPDTAGNYHSEYIATVSASA